LGADYYTPNESLSLKTSPGINISWIYQPISEIASHKFTFMQILYCKFWEVRNTSGVMCDLSKCHKFLCDSNAISTSCGDLPTVFIQTKHLLIMRSSASTKPHLKPIPIPMQNLSICLTNPIYSARILNYALLKC